MSDTNDTVDGLLAEFRGYSAGMPPGYHVTMSWHDFRVMLNRLEAARRRELAAGGNAAKLREALTDAEKTLYDSSRSMYGIPPHLHALLARIRAALSAPPRNCDVGTEEEQVLRWRGFCAREKGGVCDGCPCLADDGVEACFAKWEQTPYEEKEGGAECAPAREVRNAMEA